MCDPFFSSFIRKGDQTIKASSCLDDPSLLIDICVGFCSTVFERYESVFFGLTKGSIDPKYEGTVLTYPRRSLSESYKIRSLKSDIEETRKR